ncbi:MAG: hypothetical protein ACP5MZ_04470 [Candidatus Micrarchaeia archaeon]
MKAQMSFEFMIYMAIAIASIVASLSLYAYSSGMLAFRSSSVLKEAFAAAIEARMPYYSSTFYAVVPAGICLNDTGMPKDVHLETSLCGQGGMMKELLLVRNLNGSYTLSGV